MIHFFSSGARDNACGADMIKKHDSAEVQEASTFSKSWQELLLRWFVLSSKHTESAASDFSTIHFFINAAKLYYSEYIFVKSHFVLWSVSSFASVYNSVHNQLPLCKLIKEALWSRLSVQLLCEHKMFVLHYSSRRKKKKTSPNGFLML